MVPKKVTTTIKNADNPFGLAPITPLPSLSSNDYRLARRNSEMTRRERATVDEWNIQTLTIEAQKAKTVFGEHVIGDIHEYAAATFVEAATNIWTIRESVKIPALQVYTDSFCDRQIMLAGRHMEQAATCGVENIQNEIDRSSRVELPKSTLWERIFGQTDDF